MLDLQNLDCSGVVFFIERQHIVRISFKVRRQFVQTDKRSVSNCSSTWFGVLISALESFWREHSKWCVPQTPLVKVRGGAFGSVWFSSIQLAWTAFRVRSVIHTSSKAMRWRGDGYHCHRPTAPPSSTCFGISRLARRRLWVRRTHWMGLVVGWIEWSRLCVRGIISVLICYVRVVCWQWRARH